MNVRLHRARATLPAFGSVVLAACMLLWSTEALFPGSVASAVVLVALTVLALWIAHPGWNVVPQRFGCYPLTLFGLLLVSAGAAARFLTFFAIPLPYDIPGLDLRAATPAILAITGVEELLFRQAMYRWLEQRGVPGRTAVMATALAFGGAHLGPVFIGSPIGATFYLLQSGYLVGIGLLLGEIRRTTGSWPMSWLGHFGYNVTALYVLSVVV